MNKRGKIEKSVLLFYVLKRHFDTKQKKEIEKSEKISIIKRENSDFFMKNMETKNEYEYQDLRICEKGLQIESCRKCLFEVLCNYEKQKDLSNNDE